MLDILEINFFEGGKTSNPSFKMYNDFWLDEKELVERLNDFNPNMEKIQTKGMTGEKVIKTLEQKINPDNITVFIGGDHRFTYPVAKKYMEKYEDL